MKDFKINFKGRFYAFDLDKIFAFIDFSDVNPQIEREITEQYGGENSHVSDSEGATTKVIREMTTAGNQQMDSIRYDLIKLFITQILSCDSVENLTFGDNITMMTMIQYGFLVEIKTENNG